MAMAVNSNLVYSGGVNSGIQAPECWSTTDWEHHNLTDAWEWEDPTMNYPSRQGEEHSRMQSNEWASAVTLATCVGTPTSGEFSDSRASGSSTHSGTSVSSGIPGVAAGRGTSAIGFSSSVKNEPDDQGVKQLMVGAPAIKKDRLLFSLGRSQSLENEDRPSEETDHTQRTGGPSNGSSMVSGEGDGQNVALKLGRRTYFEDSAAKGQGKATSCTVSPPRKRQRALSPSTQLPRCQVEGCKADLSGCKDYHKRHKVCEMHSKAPKAIAAGIVQRFCQQCSRFHVLTEFDEGKRSCRRRLAGHNRRRRKPHTETHSLFHLGNPLLHRDISTSTLGRASLCYPEDSKPSFLHHYRNPFENGLHSYGQNLLRTSSWSLKNRIDNIPTFQLQSPKTPMVTAKPSSGLDLGGHRFLEEPLGPLGNCTLSLSSGGVHGSLEQSRFPSCSQNLSNVSGPLDSGRALSLLSSQSWASHPPPDAPPPVSLDLSQAADSTLELLVAISNDSSIRGSQFSHHLQLPSGLSSSTSAQEHFDKQFSIQSGGLDSVGLNYGLTTTGNRAHQHHQDSGDGNLLAGLGGYDETNSMLALVQAGRDFHALNSGFTDSNQARPTIDLMQRPSVQGLHASSHGNELHSQIASGQYSGYSSLRPFESSAFGSQQLM